MSLLVWKDYAVLNGLTRRTPWCNEKAALSASLLSEADAHFPLQCHELLSRVVGITISLLPRMEAGLAAFSGPRRDGQRPPSADIFVASVHHTLWRSVSGTLRNWRNAPRSTAVDHPAFRARPVFSETECTNPTGWPTFPQPQILCDGGSSRCTWRAARRLPVGAGSRGHCRPARSSARGPCKIPESSA